MYQGDAYLHQAHYIWDGLKLMAQGLRKSFDHNPQFGKHN